MSDTAVIAAEVETEPIPEYDVIGVMSNGGSSEVCVTMCDRQNIYQAFILNVMHFPSIVRIRLFHASTSRRHRVAPPDPVSNMPPVIYEDAHSDPQPPALPPHPYSLFEFSSTACNNQASNLELQFRLQRQQLDMFHHKFWLEVSPSPSFDIHDPLPLRIQSNSRFEAAKNAILLSLPESTTTIDKEGALSEFYKRWTIQEKEWMNAYTVEWRRRNRTLVLLELHILYQRLTSRISSFLSSPAVKQ